MRTFLLVIISILFSTTLSATHISGVNISYECLGGEDYLVTVNLFRDCQDQNNLPDTLDVFIGSTCLNLGWVHFPQVDLIEVSQLCADQLLNSTCNGGFQPGVQLGVYQHYVQLEPCIDWKIIVSENNRDEATVNLVDPVLSSVHTDAFLNNSSNICNNSPVLSLLNLPYVCVGSELFYNLGFLDSDGDSLSYALVNARTSESPNLPFDMDYVPPYSGAEPMSGMTIDPVNGQISVTPSTLGRFNTVVEVREYRNGKLIGVVHYDFLFLVNACPIPPPEPDFNTFAHVSGGGYPLNNNTIGICHDDDFCFEIAFTSDDPSVNVDLKSNLHLLVPGATETVTGTNPATIQFCGTLPPNFSGGSFIITAFDDACPVYGQNFYTINFAFRKPIKALGDTTICLGETVPISAINDTAYTWYSLSGNAFTPGDEISCNPCQNPFVTPDSSKYYVVEGQYANSTCANRDTVFVDIPLSIDVSSHSETCAGNDGIISIDVLTGSGNYKVVWNDIGVGPLSRNDLAAGTYYAEVFDNVYNCSRVDTFSIIKLPPPNSYAGEDFEVCGLTANLSAEPSYGVPIWKPISGVVYDNSGDKNTAVTVSSEGIYQFVWKEDAGGVGCIDSDTVRVTFYAEPFVEIITADSVCGLVSEVNANIQNGMPQWTSTPGLNYDDPAAQSTNITADTYGLTTLYIEVEKGICYAADTVSVLFIEQPLANAGEDLEVCGSDAEILGFDGVGNGVWSLPTGVSTTADLSDLGIPVSAPGYGSFEITRILTNLEFCTDSDTMQVRFTEIPVVDLGADRNECDSITLIDFTLPVGVLYWEVSPDLIDPGSVTSLQEIIGSYGQHQAILHADNGYGCIDSDSININFVVQPHLVSLLADTVCGLGYELSGDLVADQHYWLEPNGVTISDLNNPNSSVTANTEGDYIFYWIAENGGLCRDTSIVPVLFYDQPVTNAGEDLEVCGLSTELDATASYGVLTWEEQPGISFLNQLSPNTQVTADSYGTHIIQVQETNGICTDSDTVQVTFYAEPFAEIIAPDSLCGLVSEVSANVQYGIPQWTASAGLDFEDPTGENTIISADSYGLTTLYLAVENGICFKSDTATVLFIEQPLANAGNDVEVCGTDGEISGVDGVGNGVWSLPSGVSTTSDLSDPDIPISAPGYGNFEITRTLTNLNFCTDTDTIQVRFTEIPVVNIGDDLDECDSLTAINFTIPIGDLYWEVSPNLVDPGAVSSPQEVTGYYGQHQAILHADNGYGCIESDTININFVVQPYLESLLKDTVCGLEYELNANLVADHHYWLQPNGATLSDLNNPNSSVSASAEGNYTFFWIAENGGLCRDTSIVPVRFYDQPVTNAGEDLKICGLSTQLDATASFGILIWEDQPGLTFSNQLSPQAQVTANWYGAHIIQLQEINGVCTDADSLKVEFISTPQILNPQWECTGTDAEFVLSFDISLGDTANYEIQGLAGELSNYHFESFPLPSETPVQAVLEDFGYCGGDTLAGTWSCPIITFAGVMHPDTIRLCGDALVEALPTTGANLDGNDTLLYAFHDGSEDALGNVYDWNETPSFIFSDVLDFSETYFISAVIGNELNGGVDLNDPFLSVSAGTPVEFYELPFGEISGDIAACPYDTVFIPVNLSGDLPQEISYSFANENHTVYTDTYDFSLALVDSGTVQLISTQSEFCMGSVVGSVKISYHRVPEVSISSPPEICDGDTAFIQVEFEGQQPFTGEILRNGDSFQSINSSIDSLGFYTTQGGSFSVVNFSDQNCNVFDTASAFLHIKPMPDFSAGDDLSICTGDTLLIGNENVVGQIYTWQPNQNLLQTDMAQVEYAAVSNSPFPQYNQIYLTVERNGCLDTDTVLIIVNPLPQPQIIGADFICTGDSTWLIGYGGTNYEWSPTQYFSNHEGNTSRFSASANTVIELTAVSEAGCIAATSTQIEVREKPIAVFAVSELSGCAPLDIKLTALSANSENQYNWNLTGISGLGNNPVANPSLAEAGIYTPSLTVISPNGCSQTEVMTESIEVFSTFSEFSFSPKKPDVNHPEVYFANYSPEGVMSIWSVDSLVFSDSRNTSYSFPQHIGASYNVCLAVVDANKCRDRKCKVVKLKNDFEIYVPSAFTPNGDGINDLFYPVLSNIDVVEYKFWITNPRGRIVFSTTDINGKWDGSTGIEDDTEYYGENKIYNWHLIAKPDFNVETTYFTGHVLLLR